MLASLLRSAKRLCDLGLGFGFDIQSHILLKVLNTSLQSIPLRCLDLFQISTKNEHVVGFLNLASETLEALKLDCITIEDDRPFATFCATG